MRHLDLGGPLSGQEDQTQSTTMEEVAGALSEDVPILPLRPRDEVPPLRNWYQEAKTRPGGFHTSSSFVEEQSKTSPIGDYNWRGRGRIHLTGCIRQMRWRCTLLVLGAYRAQLVP